MQIILLVVVALFLMLQLHKKSGFGPDSPAQEAPPSPNPDLFRSPETQGEFQARMKERSLESTRAVDEAGFRSTQASPLELGQGNSVILKDLEGAVNQRNYPMVGKDQGALDYTSGKYRDVSPANAVPVNVNALAYPIEGYNLLPEFVGESDIEGVESPILDLNVPNVPKVPAFFPSSSPSSTLFPSSSSSSTLFPSSSPSSTLLPSSSPSSTLLPSSSPSSFPSPEMAPISFPESTLLPRPVIGVPGGVVSPIS